MAPHASCPSRTTEWMPVRASLDRCTWHHTSDGTLVTVWPEPFMRWARAASGARTVQADSRGDAAVPVRISSTRSNFRAGLTIVQPIGGAVYLIDPTLRPEFQTLPLAADGASPGTVDWYVNGTLVGRSASGGSLRWPLQTGTHKITARDSTGRVAETNITVR
jgi:membrane carboxypeptidase/penicillin-binding protein PbpC